MPEEPTNGDASLPEQENMYGLSLPTFPSKMEKLEKRCEDFLHWLTMTIRDKRDLAAGESLVMSDVNLIIYAGICYQVELILRYTWVEDFWMLTPEQRGVSMPKEMRTATEKRCTAVKALRISHMDTADSTDAW